MSGIFAPLFSWFFGLVGAEVKTEIQRKKAVWAKKAREKKRRAKARKKAELKLAREKEAERLRRIKSERVQRELQKQIDGLTDEVAPNDPYASER